MNVVVNLLTIPDKYSAFQINTQIGYLYHNATAGMSMSGQKENFVKILPYSTQIARDCVVNFSREAFELQATLCYDLEPCSRKFEIYVKTKEHNTTGSDYILGSHA